MQRVIIQIADVTGSPQPVLQPLRTRTQVCVLAARGAGVPAHAALGEGHVGEAGGEGGAVLVQD